MERLTTDNPQNNIETACNLFYIKGHETWVRGGGPEPEYEDMSLYDWIRRIIKIHCLDISTNDNDVMSDCLYERLFDCVDTMEGVIAHLYSAAWAFSELREKLKIYEDAKADAYHIDPVHAAGGCYCRECRYRDDIGCTHAYMADNDTVKLASPYMGDDGFCSHGEPKEAKP